MVFKYNVTTNYTIILRVMILKWQQLVHIASRTDDVWTKEELEWYIRECERVKQIQRGIVWMTTRKCMG